MCICYVFFFFLIKKFGILNCGQNRNQSKGKNVQVKIKKEEEEEERAKKCDSEFTSFVLYFTTTRIEIFSSRFVVNRVVL